MAAVVPILSIVSGVSAGMGIAAGAAVTFGSFLSIAGGMASALGLLSKDKDLKKLGGVLSLAGGISNAIQGANAAGNAATASGDAVDTAKALTQGAEGGESLLTAPGASAPQTMPTMGTLAGGAAEAPGMDFMTGIDSAGAVQAPMGGGMGGASGQSVADSLMGRAQANMAGGVAGGAPAPQMSDFLSEAAKGMTRGDVSGAIKDIQTQAGSLWDRATGAVGKAGEWVQKNPMAATFALQGVSGTMAAKAQQDALDYQRSLIERARANLNSPVRMSFTPGG